MKKWYIIKSKTGLRRTELLLQELNLYNIPHENYYLDYGYKILSSQEKETYRILHNISKSNVKNNSNATCSVKLDYLATVLNTTEACQEKRIKKLIKYKLIDKLSDNTYNILEQYPDSTFIKTIIYLIRRKKLGELISFYIASYSPIVRINIVLTIKRLINKGITHYNLNAIVELDTKKISNKVVSNNLILIESIAAKSNSVN